MSEATDIPRTPEADAVLPAEPGGDLSEDQLGAASGAGFGLGLKLYPDLNPGPVFDPGCF